MKHVMFFILAATMVGCSLFNGGSSSSPPPVMNPIQAAVCDVESTITSTTGSMIVAQCKGVEATPGACGAALQTALGNANLCGAPGVAAVTIAQIKAAKAGLHVQGVIGNIACPLAESAVMGCLTAAIPAACGCTQSIDAGSIGGLLVSACEAAVPL